MRGLYAALGGAELGGGMPGPEMMRGHSQVLPGGTAVPGGTNGRAGQAIRKPGGSREPREEQAMFIQKAPQLAQDAPTHPAIFSSSASTGAPLDALAGRSECVQTPGGPGSVILEGNGSGDPRTNEFLLDPSNQRIWPNLDARRPVHTSGPSSIEVSACLHRAVLESALTFVCHAI